MRHRVEASVPARVIILILVPILPRVPVLLPAQKTAGFMNSLC